MHIFVTQTHLDNMLNKNKESFIRSSEIDFYYLNNVLFLNIFNIETDLSKNWHLIMGL